MQVQRINSIDEMVADRMRWNQLADGIPFRCWEWLATWWGEFHERGELYVLRVTKQIFWGPPAHAFPHLEDARGPEWVALVVLVFVLVLFGMVPGLAIAPVGTATVPLLARIVSP